MDADFSEIVLSKKNILDFLEQTEGAYIIRFWAPWCASCRINEQVIKQVLSETKGSYKAYKINVDREPELANSMSVKYLPEMIVFDHQGIENRLTGEVNQDTVLNLLD